MTSPETVALIGCGKLGRYLMTVLRPHFHLIATTAHRHTAAALPIPATCYDWTQDALPVVVNQSHHAIIAIPPTRQHRASYAQHMAILAAALKLRGHILLISSTSVYPSLPDVYDEDSPPENDNIIYQAECQLRQSHPRATILRCGGIIGSDYKLGQRWFGQPCDLPNQKLNLVHGHDIATALLCILTRAQYGKTYNLVHPNHVRRHAYYLSMAQHMNAEPPHFTNPSNHPDRLINGTRITQELPFTYTHSPISASNLCGK